MDESTSFKFQKIRSNDQYEIRAQYATSGDDVRILVGYYLCARHGATLARFAPKAEGLEDATRLMHEWVVPAKVKAPQAAEYASNHKSQCLQHAIVRDILRPK